MQSDFIAALAILMVSLYGNESYQLLGLLTLTSNIEQDIIVQV